MKKIIVLLSVISVLFLAGCSLNENNKNNMSGDIDNQHQESVENIAFSNEQLIEMVKNYREDKGEYIPEFIVVEDYKDNIVTIHLYDVVDGHTATSDWYYIDRNSGIGEDLLGEKIDLNKIEDESKTDFEERTEAFFLKKKEISGDPLRREFANIKLNKVDNHYEIVADLIGDVKVNTDIMDEAIQKIKDESLEKLEIETVNNEKLIIYSQRPSDVPTFYAKDVVEENDFVFAVNELGYINIPAYDDDDWFLAKSDDEWLNQEGIPMYVFYEGGKDECWPLIEKADDGYYLCGRNLAGRAGTWRLTTTNEKNAINIKLLSSDKIALSGGYLGYLIEDDECKIITVEEYFNISPTTLEDNLIVNASNMSEANYYSAGLDISDEIIYVVSRNDGP